MAVCNNCWIILRVDAPNVRAGRSRDKTIFGSSFFALVWNIEPVYPVNSELTGVSPNHGAEPNEDYESPGILMDKDGQPLANVQVRISPTCNSGDFRLASLEAGRLALAKAASLQMPDGRRLQLNRFRICPAFHLVNPAEAHMEFELRES